MKEIFSGYKYIKPKNNSNIAWNLEYTAPYKIHLQSDITYEILSEGKTNAPVFGQNSYYRSVTIKAINITEINNPQGFWNKDKLRLLINPDWNIKQIKTQFKLS